MKRVILAVVAIGFLAVSCSSGGTGGGGSSSSNSNSSSSGGNIAFPVIYQNGKLLSGVSVTTGNYETFTGKRDGLRKGNVVLRDTYIEVTPAEGQAEFGNDTATGHYSLELKFSNNLDLTGYDGIEVVWEGDNNGLGPYGTIVYLNDATGKTDKGSWKSGNLALWLGGEDDQPRTGYFEDAADYEMSLDDFTYKITRINFDTGSAVNKDFSNYGPWKFKSVRFAMPL